MYIKSIRAKIVKMGKRAIIQIPKEYQDKEFRPGKTVILVLEDTEDEQPKAEPDNGGAGAAPV